LDHAPLQAEEDDSHEHNLLQMRERLDNALKEKDVAFNQEIAELSAKQEKITRDAIMSGTPRST
jgi:hypothetical protein